MPGIDPQEHLGLVYSTLRKLAPRYRFSMPWEDLVGYGYVALCFAAKNYTGPAAFSTYAVTTIQLYVRQRSVRDGWKLGAEITASERRNDSSVRIDSCYEYRLDDDVREAPRLDRVAVADLLSPLCEEEQRLVVDYFVFEKTLAQIGQQLGCSAEWVRRRVKAVVKRLQRCQEVRRAAEVRLRRR